MLDAAPSWDKLKTSFSKTILLGHEPTAELTAILLVYFVQGILGLARLGVSFFLKDDLGLSPVEVSVLSGFAALPWMIKPLFGFLSDSFPLLGYRRRSYLVVSGLLGTAAWWSMATLVHSAWVAALVIMTSSLSVAMSDVIVDSLVVERVRRESVGAAGSLQSLCWGASALGGLITAYLSGILLQEVGAQTLFLITSLFPLIVAAIAGLITELPTQEAPSWLIFRQQAGQLRQAFAQKSIWLPTLFLFVWQATPTTESAFFFFTTNELGFNAEFLGRVRLVTSIASLLGIWAFQRFFKTVPFRRIFGWSMVGSSLLGMTTLLLVTHANRVLGISDHWFSLGDSLVLTVMGQIAYMPVLVLAARLCPVGIEATLFALLMSVTNFAAMLSHQFGAALMYGLGINEHNFEHLWILILIANLSTLLPFPFLHWLPQSRPEANHLPIETLEPEPAFAHPSGQPFLPDFVPDLVSTAPLQSETRRSSSSI